MAKPVELKPLWVPLGSLGFAVSPWEPQAPKAPRGFGCQDVFGGFVRVGCAGPLALASLTQFNREASLKTLSSFLHSLSFASAGVQTFRGHAQELSPKVHTGPMRQNLMA